MVGKPSLEQQFHEVMESLETCQDKAEISQKLGELSFEHVDDQSDSEDELEEQQAVPKTPRQQRLVDYFSAENELPTQALYDDFLAEKDLDEPNYPLWRRYFRAGNQQLKRLILQGIKEEATDPERLHDLSFFHSFHNCLSEIIKHYMTACLHQHDLGLLRDLVIDFYSYTHEYGYNSFESLLHCQTLTEEQTTVVKQVQHLIIFSKLSDHNDEKDGM